MECKVCKKTFLKEELTDGVCDECMPKYSKMKSQSEENKIARIFKYTSIATLIIGLLVFTVEGLAMCMDNVTSGMDFILIGVISSFIASLILRGFAEIIQLLQDIKDK